MIRREFVGGAIVANLSNSISNTSMFFNVVSGADSFPQGDVPNGVDFVVTLARGTAKEEKVLISERTTNQFTVKQRGFDGTSAQSHAANTTVTHVIDAQFFQYVGEEINKNIILNWMGI